ncbi:hypothetical protein H6784_01495 [Candidatus Nomurabacteria bacterium]|nr:hypothetical protein [Candidatus Kaiserbacteria bacterium]MCB9814068.1 hypothetical protein [Candidatus Nomurabacteria bacterium]
MNKVIAIVFTLMTSLAVYIDLINSGSISGYYFDLGLLFFTGFVWWLALSQPNISVRPTVLVKKLPSKSRIFRLFRLFIYILVIQASGFAIFPGSLGSNDQQGKLIIFLALSTMFSTIAIFVADNYLIKSGKTLTKEVAVRTLLLIGAIWLVMFLTTY